jgi:WXXGXW repeat (2 copies)
MRNRLMKCIFAGCLLAGGAMAADVVIRVAPPRPIVEQRMAAPGPGYVWVGGYQRWDGRAYAWVPGRWERPPRRHAHWVAPRYVKRGHGWVFVEGHWR